MLPAALILLLAIPDRDGNGKPHTQSESVIVRFADTGEIVFEKNADKVRPIASITKLLSALVLAKRQAELPAEIKLEEVDKDRLKWSRSRLKIGCTYHGEELYRAALVASDNRAMYALVRGVGIERELFVEEMNRLAMELGMKRSVFKDPAGIDPANVSTARDLLLVVAAAAAEPRIASTTTSSIAKLSTVEGGKYRFGNTNRLLHSGHWQVLLGKTGYTVEAGRNLALRVVLGGRPIDMVFLGSREMQSIFGDAGRVRRWLESKPALLAASPPPQPIEASAQAVSPVPSPVKSEPRASEVSSILNVGTGIPASANP